MHPTMRKLLYPRISRHFLIIQTTTYSTEVYLLNKNASARKGMTNKDNNMAASSYLKIIRLLSLKRITENVDVAFFRICIALETFWLPFIKQLASMLFL